MILQDSLLVINDSGGIFSDTFTLSSKDGLVDVEAVALDGNNSAIGRNTVTNRHRDDITGNQVLGLDARDVAVVSDNVGFVG